MRRVRGRHRCRGGCRRPNRRPPQQPRGSERRRAPGRAARTRALRRPDRRCRGPADEARRPSRSSIATRFLPAGVSGRRTRLALGRLGAPLLGRRELAVGSRGWDVSALEFRLRRFGLPLGSVDGRFTTTTARALQRFQRGRGLTPRRHRGAVDVSARSPAVAPARVTTVGPSTPTSSARARASTRSRPAVTSAGRARSHQRPLADHWSCPASACVCPRALVPARAPAPGGRSRRDRPLVGRLRRRRVLPARSPGWIGLPAGRRLERRRDWRYAAPARDLGVGRRAPDRREDAAPPTTATCRRACGT